VADLTRRMNEWIARREAETGLPNPIYNQPGWHGDVTVDYFTTSQQAYDTLHIGDPAQAARLQSRSR
ncbi:MAG: sulfatase, partial [Caldilinea sp.]|nr:sulfatase [Caldilinea sp.]